MDSFINLIFKLHDSVIDTSDSWHYEDDGRIVSHKGYGIKIKKYSFHNFIDFKNSNSFNSYSNFYSTSVIQPENITLEKELFEICKKQNKAEIEKIELQLKKCDKNDFSINNNLLKNFLIEVKGIFNDWAIANNL